MKKKSHWFVYIIQAQSGKFYTGITNDLKRRLKEHQSGCRGARFFHFSSPEKIVYHEIHPDRSKASLREWEIKKLSREQKLVLIQSSSSDEF